MKHRLTIYSAIGLALFVVWGMFIYVPASKKAAMEDTLAESSQQRVAQLQQYIAQVPAILEADERMADRRRDLNSRLYAREDVLRLFDDLKKEASGHRLRVEEITPPVEELLALNRSIATSDQPQVINMTVRLSGGYIDFGRFVRSLEESDYFRGVNSCLVTGAPDGREPLQLTVAFRALLGVQGASS